MAAEEKRLLDDYYSRVYGRPEGSLLDNLKQTREQILVEVSKENEDLNVRSH